MNAFIISPRILALNLRFGVHAVIAVAVVVVVANISARPSFGEMLLHDFNDATLGDWINVEDFAAGSPFGPTQTSFVNGELVIGSNGPAPTYYDDPASFFRVTWGPSIDSTSFTNGYVRATVSPLQSEAIGGLVLRAGVDPNEVDYEFWRDARLGSFWFGRWEKNTEIFEVLASTDDFAEPYVAGEQWIIEAGIVDSEISIKYWRPGEPEPAVPQLTASDTGIPPFQADASRVELAVWHESASPFVLSAAFDDVYFTPVPEPSTVSLVLLGLLGLASLRNAR
jgi:hypothetical protein